MKKGHRGRLLPFLLALLAVLLFPACVHGLCHAEEQPKRPRVGLVLGGGGAKGAAHIGVLKVLEELKVPVDFLAGTSMGAVVGSLYASGMSPEDIEQALTSLDWDDLFSDSPPRSEIDFWRKRDDVTILAPMELGIREGGVRAPRGFIAGQKIGLLFETLLMPVSDITNFDMLPTPFRAVAADLETGKVDVLKSGRLADAARASMSVPGVFPPVEVNGRLLADGGIVRNLPVDVVRAMGADIVIAVDVGKPLPPKEKLASMLAISSQMVDIMIRSNVQAQIDTLTERDILMKPDLGTIESGDFQRGKEAIKRGMKAARAQEAALRRLSATDEEYSVYLERHQRKTPTSVKIGSVAIEGLRRVPPEAVRSKLDIEQGQEISIKQLKQRIGNVYGMGNFELVSLEPFRRDGIYDLTVRAREKSWGPNYLRWGLGLSSTGRGDSSYYILGDYTRRLINRPGAEWKNQVQLGTDQRFLTEFYQPLEYSRTLFVTPRAVWEQRLFDLYQGNHIVSQYQVQKMTAGIDFGIQPSSYGEIRLGYEGGSGSQSLYRGTLEQPRRDVDFGALRGRVIADHLDSVKFPHTGYAGVLDYQDSMPGIGGDDRYRKIDLRFLKAFTYQSYTLLASGRYGSHINSTIPIYDEFTLGGLFYLSGYQPNQLRGQQVVLGRLVAYWRAYRSMLGSFYTGGSVETGNVWQTEERMAADDLIMAGSLFVGFETYLGPVYIGYGMAERGINSFYFYLGRVFY